MSATRLFIRNISENITEEELHKEFSKYGNVTNLEIKCKAQEDSIAQKFGFVTLEVKDNYEIESCIRHFSSHNFNGTHLFVTRARESFFERLKREREESQKKEADKVDNYLPVPDKNPVIKLSEKLNPKKRKLDNDYNENSRLYTKNLKTVKVQDKYFPEDNLNGSQDIRSDCPAKQTAEIKRKESMKKKLQDFKAKQKIIQTCLTGVDKVQNKKVIFSDSEEIDYSHSDTKTTNLSADDNKVKEDKKTLFDDNESDDDINFEIKKQYEGEKGQKILDLQSRYKSDKRFTLDEKFIDNEQSEDENLNGNEASDEEVNVLQSDEKSKQLSILQEVLGVPLNNSVHTSHKEKKIKPKTGMLRFDPLQPEHTKFLVPAESTKLEPKKKTKINVDSKEDFSKEEPQTNEEKKVEVSKERFYKVSESFKETITQPASFSLRSLFSKSDDGSENKIQEQDSTYTQIEPVKEKKNKNPLIPKDKKLFVYDSSDSEDENKDDEKEDLKEKEKSVIENNEPKAVWRENLFFTENDERLKEGLRFFMSNKDENHKERKILKSIMKKRLNNSERKNQMFKKKIGGRKKYVNVNKNFKGKKR